MENDFELLRNLFNCIERIISDERGNEINDGDGILRTADNDASPTRLEEWKKSIDFICETRSCLLRSEIFDNISKLQKKKKTM